MFVIKPNLVADMVTGVMPMLVKAFRFIPISRIEHNDEQYYLVMENIILSTNNLMPNVFEFGVLSLLSDIWVLIISDQEQGDHGLKASDGNAARPHDEYEFLPDPRVCA
jgi:hypothetical protein